jgi:hypothetical protein
MKLRNIGPNQTEITTGDRTVLYSYDTPVVVLVYTIGYFRTDTRHSVTTVKHINNYLAPRVLHPSKRVETVSQHQIDRLADGAPFPSPDGIWSAQDQRDRDTAPGA